jgi:hypothetical protein
MGGRVGEEVLDGLAVVDHLPVQQCQPAVRRNELGVEVGHQPAATYTVEFNPQCPVLFVIDPG